MEVQSQGVRVYVFEVPEVDLTFGFGVGGGERQFHGDDLVVRHPHSISHQVGDWGRVGDNQV